MQELWFTRPILLQSPHPTWPKSDNVVVDSRTSEVRKAAVLKCTDATKSIHKEINKHSSYYKFIRITTFVFRIFNKYPVNCILKVKGAVEIDTLEL